jgi:hypothetical protein
MTPDKKGEKSSPERGRRMFHQLLTPVAGSLPLSSFVASLPVLVLGVLVALQQYAVPGVIPH